MFLIPQPPEGAEVLKKDFYKNNIFHVDLDLLPPRECLYCSGVV
jgi:hypothetical protein